MNKKGIEVTRKHMATVIVVVILAVVAVAGFSVVQAVTGHTVRDRIDSQYSTVSMPASIQLKDKHYNGRAFWNSTSGVNESWVYTYVPAAGSLTVRQIHDAMMGSLESAGYSVDPGAGNPEPISLDASGNGLHISVKITSDGGTATSTVREIQVQVHE